MKKEIKVLSLNKINVSKLCDPSQIKAGLDTHPCKPKFKCVETSKRFEIIYNGD